MCVEFIRVSKCYLAAAILDSKWPPSTKNPPILMKFGFEVNIGVANSFPVSKFYPVGTI